MPNVCRIVSETALYICDMLVNNNNNATYIRKPVILGAWRPVLALTYRFWSEGRRAKAPHRRSPTSKVIDFVDHPTGFFFFFLSALGPDSRKPFDILDAQPPYKPRSTVGKFLGIFSFRTGKPVSGITYPEVRLKCLFM